jgi:hypothetical protein
MRRTAIAVALCAAIAVTLSPSAAPARPDLTPQAAAKVKVPHLTGRRLDVAEDILRSHHLRFREVGGGAFGIVVKSNWRVCTTRPAAGARVRTRTRVSLYVDRSC